jgi:hypothetical protein
MLDPFGVVHPTLIRHRRRDQRSTNRLHGKIVRLKDKKQKFFPNW